MNFHVDFLGNASIITQYKIQSCFIEGFYMIIERLNWHIAPNPCGSCRVCIQVFITHIDFQSHS